jgi:hypothetical protein
MSSTPCRSHLYWGILQDLDPNGSMRSRHSRAHQKLSLMTDLSKDILASKVLAPVSRHLGTLLWMSLLCLSLIVNLRNSFSIGVFAFLNNFPYILDIWSSFILNFEGLGSKIKSAWVFLWYLTQYLKIGFQRVIWPKSYA